MSKLIGVERLEEIVASIILTGRLALHRPISAFLIAPPGCGKTSILLERQCVSATVLSDLTATGIHWTMQMFPKASHFILGDLGVVMSHSPRAREFFFANLLPLAEEGLFLVAGPKGIVDFKGAQRGLIAGTVPEDAKDYRKWWHKRGIARRILPLNYMYSENIVLCIKDAIDGDMHHEWKPGSELRVPEIAAKVEFPEGPTRRIRAIADAAGKRLGQSGVDTLKQYRALARAHTLLRGWKHPVVGDAEIDFIEVLDSYVDWERARPL